MSESLPSAGARRHFANDPRQIVDEALAGFERANRALVRWNREPSFIIRADDDRPDQVGVLSGGGSGHEPLHTGFVGRGMLDAAVPGGIFASPTALQVEAATAAVDRGRGVVHIVKNYTGDVMNFGMAAEMAQTPTSRRCSWTTTSPPRATTAPAGGAPLPWSPWRRSAGPRPRAEHRCRRWPRSAVASRRARARWRSRCTRPRIPGRARPVVRPRLSDEIELGVGIHGERGVGRRSHAPAAELAETLLGPIAEALELRSGERALLIVNGLGATHGLELSVMYAEAASLLDARGVEVERSLVGSYVTSLDMSGCSLTVVRLDDELVELWDAPVRTPALTW